MTTKPTQARASSVQAGYNFDYDAVVLGAPFSAPPIKTLLDDPGRFNDATVRIRGEVQRSVGALGIGTYHISDGTGTLPVVSRAGGAPREGARVSVEGTLQSAFTIGKQQATVLVEQRRYTPQGTHATPAPARATR